MIEEERGTYCYASKYKINNKEHEIRYNSVDEANDISEHDLNPIIFIRFNRPLRQDA